MEERRRRGHRRAAWAARSGAGQGEGEPRAVAGLAVRVQPAAVGAGQFGGHRQPDPAAGDVPGPPAAPEPVEDPGQLVGGDARPGVGDLKDGGWPVRPGPGRPVRTVTRPPDGVNFSALVSRLVMT